MATNKTKQIIEVVTKGANKSKKQLKGVEGAMGGLAKKALAAGASFFAVRGIINGMQESVKLAGKMKSVEQAFDKMGKKAGLSGNSLNKLRKAVDGTVSDLDLMTKANNAMALGLVQSDEQMADLFDTAQRLGKALGQETEAALDSLVTGMGRQCLTGDSLVLLDDSTTKKITDIKKGDIVLSYHKEKGFITTKVSHLLDNGTQPVYELICEDSKKIKSTDNHRYLTDDGWKELKDIKKGNLILNNNGEYSKVKEINYLKEEQVYDLTVPETENFFANGLCVHNSKLMLDNLGIMLDTEKAYEDYAEELGKSASALDDNEKKIAFNNAAMKEAKRLVNEMGDEQVTAADKMAKMRAELANASAKMGEVFAPIVANLAESFVDIADAVGDFFDTMGDNELDKTIKELDDVPADTLSLQFQKANDDLFELKTSLQGLPIDVNKAIGEGFENVDVLDVAHFIAGMSAIDPSIVPQDLWDEVTKQMGEEWNQINFGEWLTTRTQEQWSGQVLRQFPFQLIKDKSIEELEEMKDMFKAITVPIEGDMQLFFDHLAETEEGMAKPTMLWALRMENAFKLYTNNRKNVLDEDTGLIEVWSDKNQKMMQMTEKEFLKSWQFLSDTGVGKQSIEQAHEYFGAVEQGYTDWIDKQNDFREANLQSIEALQHMIDYLNSIEEGEETVLKLQKEIDDRKKLNDKDAGAGPKEEAKQLGILQKIKMRYDQINDQNTRKSMLKELQAAQTDTTAWLIKQIMKNTPFPVNLVLAATAEAQVNELFSKLGNVKKAQYGADFIADSPQLMMVGEGSGAERVQVTPLVDPNLEGTQSEGITLNISGNVLHESFVEDNVVPQIREALRMGENLGV